MKESFILYTEQKEVIDKLTDEQAGKLIKAIYEYVKTGQMPHLDAMLDIVITPIKQSLDKNAEKWEDEKQKRSEAGKKGMAKRWGKNNNAITNITKDNSVINAITKITDNVNVNVNVNDNVSATANIKGDSCADGSKQFDSCVDGIVKFYEENIGTISPHTFEVLDGYRENFSDDVIIYALQLSVEANAKGINYTKAILNNWQKANVKTLIDAQKENSNRKPNASNTNQVANLYHTSEYENLDKFYLN